MGTFTGNIGFVISEAKLGILDVISPVMRDVCEAFTVPSRNNYFCTSMRGCCICKYFPQSFLS